MTAVAQMNGQATANADAVAIEKPYLELYVKASAIDARRIGACLFCQEFWMELYALYELGLVRVEVKTVNPNSEGFKRNFLGAQPPIMIEVNKKLTYTDNRELEGRIFHIAKDFQVPLFEKDTTVEKRIETLFRNFKIFVRAAIDEKGGQNGQAGYAQPAKQAYLKLVEQLNQIDQLLKERNTRYLLGSSMTEYDCELMPRLHHIRIAGAALADFEIPHELTHLWNYILTAYRTAAFLESCPADQDIIQHYKDQLTLQRGPNREALAAPTKNHQIPDNVLSHIKSLNLCQ